MYVRERGEREKSEEDVNLNLSQVCVSVFDTRFVSAFVCARACMWCAYALYDFACARARVRACGYVCARARVCVVFVCVSPAPGWNPAARRCTRPRCCVEKNRIKGREK